MCVEQLSGSLCEGCAVKRAWPSKPNISLPSRVRETARTRNVLFFARQPALRLSIFLPFFSTSNKTHGSDFLFTPQTSCWWACSVAFFLSESKTWRRIERLAAYNKQRKEMSCDGWVNATKFLICVYGKHHTRRSNFHTHIYVCVAFHQWASNRTDTTLGCTRLSLSLSLLWSLHYNLAVAIALHSHSLCSRALILVYMLLAVERV